MKYLRGRTVRVLALAMALNVLLSTLAPTVSYALTGGPSSPEFSSFEPVATTDMVNVFSGDFTYNLPVLDIPGPDGAGYSLSLAYHSGTSPEEEASWVGYGWTLNPGAINRDTRGFPDDYNQAPVDYYNKTRANWSVGATDDIGLEFFSKDSKSTFGLSASASLRFNNYQGYQRSYGLGVDVLGMLNLGLNYSAEGVTYSAHVNPGAILARLKSAPPDEQPENEPETTASDPVQKSTVKYDGNIKSQLKSSFKSSVMQGIGNAYGLLSFNESSKPVSLSAYTGDSFNFSTSLQINTYPPVGIQVGISGNFNYQYNVPGTTKTVFGFMNNIIEAGENQMSDYYVEKGSSYSKRDYFLGIPFNNADNFNVTGEGLGGGFRFYPQKNGHFYADKVKSRTTTSQAGIEFMLGQNIGVGMDIGIGVQKLQMENWPKTGNTGTYTYSTPGGIFRFNNDLGGEVAYSANDDAETALVSQLGSLPGFKRADIAIPASMNTYLNGNAANLPAGRSSYIDYHTNTQLATSPALAFNKTSNLSELTYRTAPANEMKSGIAEMTVHNADGNQYVYGLPTYTRNEANLQFEVDKSSASIYDNYLAYQNAAVSGNPYTPDLSKHRTLIGEVKRTPYANNFLLTQILTSDYVDVGSDGVSDNDFGGWTQFNYFRKWGNTDANWYRYRTPYSGLLYQKNDLSDTKDDLGSVITGEKEVYYLKTIETKTHIAFFVTNKSDASRFPSGYNTAYLAGTQNQRLDGFGASKDVTGGFEKSASSKGHNARGEEDLEYLEQIVLFSKARKDKPVKITKFAYSYSLVENLPNNQNGNFPDSKSQSNSGKLTLEKVWFEYEGIVNSKISPYVFKYEYKDVDEITTRGENDLLTKYPVFADYVNRYTKESQNPDYNPHLLDPWGNIQNFGREQQLKDRSWIYQGPDNIPANAPKKFDPAAWQLKQIKLPSGGEILVEYEQKDYRFVQDRPAMAMASLASVNDNYNNPTYIVNTRDLNISTTAERDELVTKILDFYGNGKEKIYFKFLYALKGTVAELDFCKSEYIDGYATLLNAEPVASGLDIKITLEGKTVTATSGLRYNSPRQACYDLVANQRVGKVDETIGDDCTTVMEDIFDARINDIAEGNGAERLAIKFALVPLLIGTVHGDLASPRYKIPSQGSVCTTMNAGLSYLKLPMVQAKKGGGIRVKRLYMLDHGLESGDAALYGTEYRYENEDGKSSGVATNEPPAVRCENPLVTFLPKKSQSWFSRITTGEEKDQTEGPLGESLLPGPSVGHSRVVVNNIHQGPTGTGFVIHEYFTAKDYPFDKSYNVEGGEINGKSITQTNMDDNKVTDRLKLPAAFFTYGVDKVWAAQGFRFVINNMDGQIKKMSTYGGDYADFTNNTNKTFLSSAQGYTYYEPGEKVKVLKPDGTYSLETPGKEMDVAMEMKSLHDQSMDFSIEMDISITISVWPPIFFSLWPSFQLNDSRISTHVTSKVLRYPAIVRSVTNYKDGIYHTSENLAFNGANGSPILVKTNDGYDGVTIGDAKHDGSIYALTIPASWKYTAMGQKSTNSDNTNQLNAVTGTFVTYGANGNPLNADNTWTSSLTAADNVLSAQVQTFSNSNLVNSWFSTEVQANYAGIPAAKTKLDKIWRPFETYSYKTEARSSNKTSDDDKVYKGGTFKTFTMFDWTKGNADQTDANWLKLNQVTKYSPHGNALEEKNILGIYSAVRYDYAFGNSKNLLPVIMTSNGEYRTIGFDSFETSGTATSGHAGAKSMTYSGTSAIVLSGLTSSTQLTTKGGIFKMWLRSDHPDGPLRPDAIVNSKKVAMDKVARTGDWTLYSVNLDKGVFPTAGTAFTVSVAYTVRTGENVSIDDVRFQPIDAQSTCYVYDVATFKLLTQFDDQHFGLYYQYNSEGKLIRKQIETEKGLKTLQETQYNTPKLEDLQ